MHYKVVFDVAQTVPDWQFPCIGLLFIVIGFPFFLPPISSKFARTLKFSAFRMFFLFFSIIWTMFASWKVFADYTINKTALANGSFRIVEGPVQNFHPMPVSGHALESFNVGDRHFTYSDYVVSSGFHNAHSHGGPIYEGLPVRISYLGNTILKLEIADK